MSEQANGKKKTNKQEELPKFDPLAEVTKAIERQNQTITALAQALVTINEKIDNIKTPAASGNDAVALLRELTKGEGGGSMSLEGFLKQAETLSRAGEAIDRFRNPPRITPAEAMLMRAGLDRLRHPIPRYMTKDEIKRYEKILGVEGALDGYDEGGGESGHLE